MAVIYLPPCFSIYVQYFKKGTAVTRKLAHGTLANGGEPNSGFLRPEANDIHNLNIRLS